MAIWQNAAVILGAIVCPMRRIMIEHFGHIDGEGHRGLVMDSRGELKAGSEDTQTLEDHKQSDRCHQLAVAAVTPQDKAFWSCLENYWLYSWPLQEVPAPLR